LTDEEKAAAKAEYDSIRKAEKAEAAAEKAELDHKSSTMEQIRSKAYWDHMNASKVIMAKSKEMQDKFNIIAYENRGISTGGKVGIWDILKSTFSMIMKTPYYYKYI